MKTYFVLGHNEDIGDHICFSGSMEECQAWIWDNCDICDLYNCCMGRWSGYAYYDENNRTYKIKVDRYYGLE